MFTGKTIFNWRDKTINFARRRATDLKGNSRVYFPRKARSVEVESNFQTLRSILMTTFRTYTREYCDRKGKQKTNLSGSQEAGLKSLRKRINEGELLVVPTDKSGTFAAMSRTAYWEAGMVHTKNDKEVSWRDLEEA